MTLLATTGCAAGYLVRDPESNAYYYSATRPTRGPDGAANFVDCGTGQDVELDHPFSYRYLDREEWNGALQGAAFCRSTAGHAQGCVCGDAK
ncbi:MAG: hypothetical protein HYY13_12905 [Nitrospirae bacterium]|nr:hypothetical protein [Nitrospirota bacterium]